MAGLQVYFCGSIRGGRADKALYARIVRKLRQYGRVLTEHVASEGLTERGEDTLPAEDLVLHDRDAQCLKRADPVFHDRDAQCLKRADPVVHDRDAQCLKRADQFIHDRDIQWLNQADVVVAEVTQPSLGVGYELGRAVAMNKKVMCLFRPSSGRCLSAMIRGAQNQELFFVKDYEEEDVERILEQYFKATFPDAVATKT